PPGVADRVVAREADAEEIGRVVRAEFLRDDRALHQLQQDLVAEGGVVDCFVIRLADLLEPARHRMWERDALRLALPLARRFVRPAVLGVVEVLTQAGPILAEPAIAGSGRVVLAHPGMETVAIVGRGGEAPRVHVPPVAGVGLRAAREDGPAILERQRY